MVYISSEVDSLFLSRAACRDLCIIGHNFPEWAASNMSSESAYNSQRMLHALSLLAEPSHQLQLLPPPSLQLPRPTRHSRTTPLAAVTMDDLIIVISIQYSIHV